MNQYTTPEHQAAACLAIERAGGPTAMAEKLTRLTGEVYKPYNVLKWKKAGVPAHLVLWVEYVTGIGVERLRPDMSPKANLPEARA